MKKLLIPPAVFVLLLSLYHWSGTGSFEGEIWTVADDSFTVDCSDETYAGFGGGMFGEGEAYSCKALITDETILTNEEEELLEIGDFEKGAVAEFTLKEARRITENQETRVFEVEKVILRSE